MFLNQINHKKNKNKNIVLIANRGRSDVAVRLGFLAQKISIKKKLRPFVLYEGKKIDEMFSIFKLFNVYESDYIGVKLKNFNILLNALCITTLTLFKVYNQGFDWFVRDYSIDKVRLGDLIYDRFIRKGLNFINPSVFKIRFIYLLFSSIYKFLIVRDFFNKNNVRYSLIGSMTYISVSSIILRISQKKNIPVIYVSGESYKIIKKGTFIGDVISDFLKKKLNLKNQKKLLTLSEEYFKKRIKGKLTVKNFNPKLYFQHDEQTWKVNNQNNNFLKKILKIKKKYSHVILFAPHNFAESNHRCGDLIFRDFYQQTEQTLEFAKKKENILWLYKIHPYSHKKYGELKISKDLLKKFKNKNIHLVPEKTSNERLFKIVDLVVSTRGTICLEAATFGIKNLINSNIYYYYYDRNISIKVKKKTQYFNVLTDIKSYKKIKSDTVKKAKKILYLRKKLQKENPYNLNIARKLMNKNEFYRKLKKNIKTLKSISNNKNKMYDEIVDSL